MELTLSVGNSSGRDIVWGDIFLFFTDILLPIAAVFCILTNIVRQNTEYPHNLCGLPLVSSSSNSIFCLVKGQTPAVASSDDIHYGKLTFEISTAKTYKCNVEQFVPPFSTQDVFVQVAPSRSSAMTRPLLQAVTVWLEWTNSTAFSACVETSGPSGDVRVSSNSSQNVMGSFGDHRARK